jgi:hypothetical protein
MPHDERLLFFSSYPDAPTLVVADVRRKVKFYKWQWEEDTF